MVSVAGELVEPTPSRIEKVATRVSVLLFIFYALIGVLGYYSFGNSVSQNFMNSFPADDLTSTCRFLLTLTLLLSLPITANPTSHAIVHYALALTSTVAADPSEIEPFRLLRIAGAAIILGSSALVASYTPGAADVLSILGGSFGTLLMLVFPALISRAIFRDDMTWSRSMGIGLMVFGSCVSFASVITTVLSAIGII